MRSKLTGVEKLRVVKKADDDKKKCVTTEERVDDEGVRWYAEVDEY